MDFYHSRPERSALGVNIFDIEVSLRSLICEDKNLRRNAEIERQGSFRTGTITGAHHERSGTVL